MTIKCVRSTSDGCHSLGVFCDGEIHVHVESVTCHHTQDFNNPDDPNYRVNISACVPSQHHDSDTCYECMSDLDSERFNCRFYSNRQGESRGYVEKWAYEWSTWQKGLIEEWRNSLSVDEVLSIEVPWTAAHNVWPKMEMVKDN